MEAHNCKILYEYDEDADSWKLSLNNLFKIIKYVDSDQNLFEEFQENLKACYEWLLTFGDIVSEKKCVECIAKDICKIEKNVELFKINI